MGPCVTARALEMRAVHPAVRSWSETDIHVGIIWSTRPRERNCLFVARSSSCVIKFVIGLSLEASLIDTSVFKEPRCFRPSSPSCAPVSVFLPPEACWMRILTSLTPKSSNQHSSSQLVNLMREGASQGELGKVAKVREVVWNQILFPYDGREGVSVGNERLTFCINDLNQSVGGQRMSYVRLSSTTTLIGCGGHLKSGWVHKSASCRWTSSDHPLKVSFKYICGFVWYFVNRQTV